MQAVLDCSVASVLGRQHIPLNHLGRLICTCIIVKTTTMHTVTYWSIFQLMEMNKVTSEDVSMFLSAVLFGLQKHGQHESEQQLLLPLALRIYELAVSCSLLLYCCSHYQQFMFITVLLYIASQFRVAEFASTGSQQ